MLPIASKEIKLVDAAKVCPTAREVWKDGWLNTESGARADWSRNQSGQRAIQKRLRYESRKE